MRFKISLPENKPFDVVGMGLNSVDFLVAVPEFPAPDSKMKIDRLSKQGGGQVATAMVALSRWGMKARYVGKVGSDDLGRFSLDSIRQEGVDVSSVIAEPNVGNQIGLIIVDGLSGRRTILWDRDERLMYRNGELRKEEICSGRILHLDGHDIRAAMRCARWAREEGIPTVIDLDKAETETSELLKEIDFIITSSRFPELYTGIADMEGALREIRRRTSGFLCATLGAEGAVALAAGEFLYVKGMEVNAVDTTGAGDVFHAGFIYGLLQNWELTEILNFANAVAALKCRELGGRKGIPTLNQIKESGYFSFHS